MGCILWRQFHFLVIDRGRMSRFHPKTHTRDKNLFTEHTSLPCRRGDCFIFPQSQGHRFLIETLLIII